MQITDPDKIEKFIKSHKQEARALEKQIVEIMWYMRGSITREDAWRISHMERMDMLELIKNNIERVNKTGIALI